MNCEYFGKCGSCTLHDMNYEEQLSYKVKREEERFKDFTNLKFDIIKSESSHFRNRVEFKIWKDFSNEELPTLSYAMSDINKNVLEINSCSIVSPTIAQLMPLLLTKLQEESQLRTKLFAIEFLTSSTQDTLVTLIYHTKLDETWISKAQALEKEFNIKIMGRSKKQKIVLSEDFIQEQLTINEKAYHFQYKEGGFTQPNTQVNIQMIEWVLNHAKSGGDLCELYCGGGNFTIPLSTQYEKVLATEISKTSIKSAQLNCSLNHTDNIEFIRMSAEEFVEALNEVREFNRLKEVDLKSYNFSTIFVDPPRAGLDDLTRALVQEFKQIIYISCNPETLHRDLDVLNQTHEIKHFALFDQFAYTQHIESGVILIKR